jgi:uncharacterized protein (DUF433 family)
MDNEIRKLLMRIKTMDTILSINLITTNPKIRGGRPCIMGTGIRVTDIVMAHIFHNRLPGEIATAYALPISSIYAALAYYYEHKVELDSDIREQIRVAREYKENGVGSRDDSLLPR